MVGMGREELVQLEVPWQVKRPLMWPAVFAARKGVQSKGAEVLTMNPLPTDVRAGSETLD